MPEKESDRIRTKQQRLAGPVVVQNDAHGVDVCGIRVVAVEDLGGKPTLQRGETKCPFRIAAQNEPDETIAQSADAIVEEDGIGYKSVLRRTREF